MLPYRVVLLSLAVAYPLAAQEGPGETRKGVILRDERALAGYTLLAPLMSKSTHLIDMDGKIVHTWKSDYTPGNSVYLLENGNLLRTAMQPDNPVFRGGGQGGRVQEFTWDGELVWDFQFSNEQYCQHHDVTRLPNGNVILIAWERKSADQAEDAGRDKSLMRAGEFWPDMLVEIEPEPPQGGKIVWEWHAWDHLIQDNDPEWENYGDVAAHPEKIDINGERDRKDLTEEQQQKLTELGYFGGGNDQGNGGNDDQGRGGQGRLGRGGSGFGADWMHTNGIDYNEELDQIAISVRMFSEIWVIDHSTTTEEAAGSTGGRCARGGDLLYRFGNPQTHRAGTPLDQKFFHQHNVTWITQDCEGAGNFLVFNNGEGRLGDRKYSSVEEWEPPLKEDGTYDLEGATFGPECTDWVYFDEANKFFSSFISGAQRLQNGNTLICSGEQGRVFEVTLEGEVVWDYQNDLPAGEGFTFPGGPPGGFQRGGPGDPGVDGPGGDAGDTTAQNSPGQNSPGQNSLGQNAFGQDDTGQEDRNRRGGDGRRGGRGRGGFRGPGGFGGGGPSFFRATRLALDFPAFEGKDLKPLANPKDESK